MRGSDEIPSNSLISTLGQQPDPMSLKLFIGVVELGNIAQASRKYHIAASAVSRRIADLEDRLGVKLLNRLRDGVTATAAGQVLVRHARRVLHQLDDLQAELSEHAKGVQGRVRIWANSSSVTQFLPEDLAFFGSRFPQVGIELSEGTSAATIEGVCEGVADLGIFSEHVHAGGLQTTLYRRDTLMAIMPMGHPLAGRKSVGLADLARYDQVGLQQGSSLQGKLVDEAALRGIELNTRVKVMSFDAVMRMVEVGMGVSVLPQGVVLPYLRPDTLAAVPISEKWATRSLLIGYREFSALPVVARMLLECLAPGPSTA